MASIDRARFLRFARPGNAVQLDVEIEMLAEEHARIIGRASHGGCDLAHTRMTFRLVEPLTIIAPQLFPAYRQMMATWLGEYPEDHHA